MRKYKISIDDIPRWRCRPKNSDMTKDFHYLLTFDEDFRPPLGNVGEASLDVLSYTKPWQDAEVKYIGSSEGGV